MTYQRVIPRDLFNEASLLKCYGALYIALERHNRLARLSQEDMPGFEVIQRDDDGAIFIAGLDLIVGQATYRLTRPLNSRQPWPLYAENHDDPNAEPVAVFNDEGKLTVDMLNLLGVMVAA